MAAKQGIAGQEFGVREGPDNEDTNPKGRRKKTLKARIERLRLQVDDYGKRVSDNTATPMVMSKLNVANADLRAKVAELDMIDAQVKAAQERRR